MKLLVLTAVHTAILTGSIAVLGTPASAAVLNPAATFRTSQSAAPVKPTITSASAFDAPLGEEGGISNPLVRCGNDWRVRPAVRWTLTSREIGEERTFRGRDGYPNQWFPRVPPGKYRSTMVATCNGVRATRTEKLVVGEKTAETTVSRDEWNQIQVGTTTAQVRKIVGYGGVAAPPYQGTVSRTYDMMPFWLWSVVVYRDGRVIKKFWNVGHD